MPASHRQPVHGRDVVATSQPLATTAGLDMLGRGGNAIDAAVAAAICLTVTEPTSNGIGGDLFAVLNDGERLVGLNASGRSPAAWSADRFAGLDAMPTRGWDSVTVPGCVAGWRDLNERFGKLPFATLFEPAVRHAREGLPVGPITAAAWQRAAKVYDEPAFADTFLPAPAAGDVWQSRAHATTLESIAETQGDAFYRGDLARHIIAASDAAGGAMTLDDLSTHENLWYDERDLVRVDAFGVSLYEIPPNGQGIAACMALGIAANLNCDDWQSDRGMHLQIEAMKLAFADLHAHVADADAMAFDYRKLVEPTYLAERAKLVDMERAATYAAGVPTAGGTVNLVACDESGMMVSLIQSNYMGFGSGIVVPGTGIAMQNRGAGFVTTPGHPNQVGPSKRPFHTIIPGFVKQDGRPLMPMGLMGGPMQAQGHLQLMLRLFAGGEGVQQAVDAPRWQVMEGLKVLVEQGVDNAALQSRGYAVETADAPHFGGAQLARRLPDGTYEAASDPRKDGRAGVG